MKYLVTGGSGFIGSNLCDFLVDKGHDVIVVDDLSTGKISNLSRVIDSIIFFKERVEFFDFDKIPKIDAIVHLAAQPSVPLSVTDFGNSSASNILGSIRIINYCRINQVPFVYASSSAIYGNLIIGNDSVKETDLLSPYATDKYAMELYARTAYKLYNLSSVGLRFFNVYGPRQDPSSPYSGVISIFADRIAKGRDIKINGGKQTRDFVYVKDVVDTIYRAIVISSNNVICEVSNVLTGRSVTIDYLADQMMDIVGVEVEKKYKDLPLGDPLQSDGTTANMVKVFSVKLEGFVKLEEGLVDTIQYIVSTE
jgi:UDP-glucose 4-epimerase